MNKPETPQIPFIDLVSQRRRLGARVDDAIRRVVDRGTFILGPEVFELERELAAFCGVREVVTCGNGTDALALALMAKGVGPGDAVLCPSFTFAATAEVVVWLGAVPIFVDVHADTFNIDAANIDAALATAHRQGVRPVGIIPVDLFGQPVAYDDLLAAAAKHDLWVLCDAAQSFGARYKDRTIGTIGTITATSFFPSKPLGCYGDGGALFTDDHDLAEVIRSLRVHGQGVDKYDNVRIGMNGRLDTIQAAVLLEKLKIFPDEIAARQRTAERYNRGLHNVAVTPVVPSGCTSVWAQYSLRFPNGERDAVAAHLKDRGIPTAIYYAKPLHRQTAYRDYPVAEGGLPITDMLSREVLSLPMHPYLDADLQDMIIREVTNGVAS